MKFRMIAEDALQAVPASEASPLRIALLSRILHDCGQPAFGASVLDFLRPLVSFDSALLVYYRRRRRPNLLCDELVNPGRGNTSSQYISEAYKADPVYMHARGLVDPEIVRTLDIVGEEFDQSDYFRAYYRLSGVVDEINILVPIELGRCFAVSLEPSAGSVPFEAESIEDLRAWLPFLDAAFRLHRRLDPDLTHPEEESDTLDLQRVLRQFGTNILTGREQEIAQMILAGHSAPSISINLGISVETVRVHRRNIYDKLGVTSIAELFGMVLRTIDEAIHGEVRGDPTPA